MSPPPPNFHNPTGAVLSPERRRQVLDIARAVGAFILEDDFARLLGVLAQSAGFFVHLAVGRPGSGSLGTALTRTGALLLAGALVALAVGLIRAL